MSWAEIDRLVARNRIAASSCDNTIAVTSTPEVVTAIIVRDPDRVIRLLTERLDGGWRSVALSECPQDPLSLEDR